MASRFLLDSARLANRLQVAHSSFTPVLPCSSSARSTMASKFLLDSAKLAPSGAISRSWKVQYLTPSFVKNSKPALRRRLALARLSVPSPQGRSSVGKPNGSAPVPLNVCQKQTEKRSHSSMVLPCTTSEAL